MNRCLYCYQTLDAQSQEAWHRHCIRSFFGSNTLPILSLEEDTLSALAKAAISVGTTTTGVQPKLSVGIDSHTTTAKLTVVDYPARYIVKPQSPAYAHLLELESVAMTLAQKAQIQTVDFGLLREQGGTLVYITRRVDRIKTPERVRKLTMEDFCQLSGRLTEDKYKGSYEQCGAIIRRYSTQAMLDSTNLFYLILFSFVIGNNDGHLKNFSLYTPEPGHTFLSPAYDLLPVSLVLPQDPKESALTLNGKKSRISRRDFLSLADSLQLPRNVAPRFIDRLHTLQDVFSRIITDSFIPQTYQEQLIALIDQRLRRLRE